MLILGSTHLRFWKKFKLNFLGRFSYDKKYHAKSSNLLTQKKSRNLSGQKKSCNLLWQKNHKTSCDKKNHATSRDKKKSHNLLEQKKNIHKKYCAYDVL